MFAEAARRLLGTVTETLQSLEADCSRLLAGVEKKELTAWWHRVLKSRTHAFLSGLPPLTAAQGYDHDAVPLNWSEQAPTNFAAVRKNLDILHKILDKSSNNFGIREFLAARKAEIYPRINSYIHRASVLLADAAELTLEQVTFDIYTRLSEELGPGASVRYMEDEQPLAGTLVATEGKWAQVEVAGELRKVKVERLVSSAKWIELADAGANPAKVYRL